MQRDGRAHEIPIPPCGESEHIVAFLQLTVFMFFIMFPLWIPVAVTVGPKVTAGVRRARGATAKRPQLRAVALPQQRPAV
ncbi:hypothetical protein BST20_12480 [Mycobacterium branderi]|uniref:Uncharacterized protein n=1 Tax=Mycobacterium branderi TaxID=43348 RepID=A0A7I7W304_9MYCO|nr:hypothetical protein BST20_12480 [Mycobacterium branderi]BBZ11061.1 hypothetical protein MBRA_12560 [Mycobacterium branderi]